MADDASMSDAASTTEAAPVVADLPSAEIADDDDLEEFDLDDIEVIESKVFG